MLGRTAGVTRGRADFPSAPLFLLARVASALLRDSGPAARWRIVDVGTSPLNYVDLMQQFSRQVSVSTQGKGFYEATHEVVSWVEGLGINEGLLTVFLRHTSASLLIQENADPDVVRDLETFFSRLVPEDNSLYTHTMEGPDDMPAHIRAALTQSQLSVPIVQGRPALGTWQGIYVFEHRRHPHSRTLALHVLGE